MPTRNTIDEVYTSILSDIENARKLINRKEWEAGYNYRFTTLAVDAFDSRVHLYMGKWQTAYDAPNAYWHKRKHWKIIKQCQFPTSQSL